MIFYNINSRENFIKAKEEYLKEFSNTFNLPKPLLKQVKFYVRYNYRHNVFCWSDMNNFLKELPSKLYTKVYNHIFKDVLDNITFFKSKPPGFISELMPLLKTVVVHEGYEIYSYGSTPRDVFFLLKGRVIVKDKNDTVLFSYVRGSYFGEIELLYKTDRKCSLQVEETAHLLKADGNDFVAVIQNFQDIKEEIEEVAAKRFKYYLDRKKKFKQARVKLEELQKMTSVNLTGISPLVQDIMNMKLDSYEKEENAKDYQDLSSKIFENVKEINEQLEKLNEFYQDVINLKKE